jgi:hypothetical protein
VPNPVVPGKENKARSWHLVLGMATKITSYGRYGQAKLVWRTPYAKSITNLDASGWNCSTVLYRPYSD